MKFINKILNAPPRFIIRQLIVFYIVGVVIHLVAYSRPYAIALTPLVLLGFGCWVFRDAARPLNRTFLVWSILTYIVTLFLEIAGVATGAVFGSYEYGESLGFKVMGVPLVIGFNWLLIILGLSALVGRKIRNAFMAAVITAALCVLFDYVMEPVAIRLDYWTWEGGDIPMQNYAAWGLIAFAAALAYNLLKIKVDYRVPAAYVMVQFVFFLILRFTLV